MGANLQMANESDTGIAVGGLGRTIASAIVNFNKAAVGPNCINMVAAKPGTNSVNFPVYSKIALAQVTNGSAGAEGAEDANFSPGITTTANNTVVLRHTISTTVTDLANFGNDDALMVNAGAQLGNAVAAEFDQHVADVGDGFGTSIGSSTTSMSFKTLMDGVGTLESNSAPRPYNAMLHPLQVYGEYGLSGEVGQVAAQQASGAFGNNSVGDQIVQTGFITQVGGVSVFNSPNINATSDQHKGFLSSKGAIGGAFVDQGGGSFIELRTDRLEREASTLLVANGYWAITLCNDTYGVTVHTESS
tara:strand:- start:4213 stop:5124 length:912 start_codon:yes stop_codon:yes gene_type:complete